MLMNDICDDYDMNMKLYFMMNLIVNDENWYM